MSSKNDSFRDEVDVADMPIRGTNFLVSAIMILRKQKNELQAEVKALQDRVNLLERQNASFLEISAERLIHH